MNTNILFVRNRLPECLGGLLMYYHRVRRAE